MDSDISQMQGATCFIENSTGSSFLFILFSIITYFYLVGNMLIVLSTQSSLLEVNLR